MPKMVTIKPTPGFKPKAEERALFANIQKQGKIKLSYVSAIENIRRSGGMYTIEAEKEREPAPIGNRLEDMPIAELKVLMLQTGIKTEKQMKRSEIIALIQKKLDGVEVLDDE